MESLNKIEKKIYVPKDKRESISELRMKHDLGKLNFNINDQVSNVYPNFSTRLKLKEHFYFNDEFWDILMNVDNTKLQGHNLLEFVKILSKTLCQRLDVWEKFVNCLDSNLQQMANKDLDYKPMRIHTFFEIIREVYKAQVLSGGMNIPCHLLGQMLKSNKNMIINMIRLCKDFYYFEILFIYKFYVGIGDSALENVVQTKLVECSDDLPFFNLTEILNIYRNYYDDSNHTEFSLIGN